MSVKNIGAPCLGPIAAALVLLTPFTGHGALLTGVILAALVAIKLVVLSGPPPPH